MRRPGIKEKNRENVFINQNFIIRVQERVGRRLVYVGDSDDVAMVDEFDRSRLTSANKISMYLKDEKLKIRLFKKLLDSGAQNHTILIRNRLRIKIYSK